MNFRKLTISLVTASMLCLPQALLAGDKGDCDRDRCNKGGYVAGDFHNHTTFSDGSVAIQRLEYESLDTWGLDWFAQSGQNRFDYLVEVGSEAAVRSLVPNLELLRGLPARGVIVTARSDNPDYDFVSRFFAPAVGIDEDPVTGSAHCCLGPYWSARFGKTELVGYQASRRSGVVRVQVAGGRVLLGGQAVTVLRAEFA